MPTDAWITLSVLVFVLGLLVLTRIAADLIMASGLTLLLTLGILKPAEALMGFANEGVATVAVLYVVAAGLRETGAMLMLAQHLLGLPSTVLGAQARLMAPIAAMSAFMNNTPLVAMMLPIVGDWTKKTRLSPSKLMMPLSFATILGGLSTLVGTSTNLVVSGQVVAALKANPTLAETGVLTELSLFDPAWIGVPCCLVGLAYIMLASRWLLPDRIPPISQREDPRNYTVEMLVEPGSPLVGRTIEAAGLRHLPGLYLMEIERGGEVLPAVGSDTRLHGGDRLVFVGVIESVVDLRKVRGLVPATNQVFKLDAPRTDRCLVEAVVSNTCPLAGKTIREGRFRSVYNAAVIAVARNGERLAGKMGDIVLQAGDTLLLEAHPSFAEGQRDSRDFFLVSRVEDSSPPRHDRAWTALAILAIMVLAAGFEVISMLGAGLLAGGAMLATGCLDGRAARRAVDWTVLVTIACSFGIGRALESSQAAHIIATTILGPTAGSPWLALAVVYLLTMTLTEVLTNTTAVIIVFPIALATATGMGVSAMPFVLSIMMAASCGFATPIGYQTNLMVYGPGGYRFTDFARFGGLLNLVVFAVTITLAPRIWPF